MSNANSLARVLASRASRIIAHRQIRSLRRHGGADGTRIAAALERALGGSSSAESQDWIVRIESLRTRLRGDTTPLAIDDFGAGSAGDDRSSAEMAEGVVVHKTVSDMCQASKPRFWASILHELVREYRPTNGVELGTCLGLSAAYQGAAMEINGFGRFVTLEGAPALAQVSSSNLAGLGLSDRVSLVIGRFADTLAGVIDELSPIDYAFIDGHHDEHATVEYFEQLLPHLSEHAVLVFDDTSWTDGMKRAWATIVAHEAVKVAVDLGAVGICVVDPDIAKRPKFTVSLRGL